MASVSSGAQSMPAFGGQGAARTASAVVAALFLVVGVLGFIPGVTSGYETMTFWGHHSNAMLLGVFQVSALHNIVHLAFGVVGAVMSARAGLARAFLAVGGFIYLALWVYGLLVHQDSAANFVPVNDADNWLHLVLGVAMILLGALLGARTSANQQAR